MLFSIVILSILNPMIKIFKSDLYCKKIQFYRQIHCSVWQAPHTAINYKQCDRLKLFYKNSKNYKAVFLYTLYLRIN